MQQLLLQLLQLLNQLLLLLFVFAFGLLLFLETHLELGLLQVLLCHCLRNLFSLFLGQTCDPLLLLFELLAHLHLLVMLRDLYDLLPFDYLGFCSQLACQLVLQLLDLLLVFPN